MLAYVYTTPTMSAINRVPMIKKKDHLISQDSL